MAPPSATQAALEGVLKVKYGRHSLLPSVQAKLVTYWVGRGESVADLPWDVDVDDEAGWQAEWVGKLRGAGVTGSEEDEVKLINWLKARGSSKSKSSSISASNTARAALLAMEEAGVVATATQQASIESALLRESAGTEEQQCCNAKTAFILLTNRAPDPTGDFDEVAWWEEQYASLGGKAGGRIDIPSLPFYDKMHKQTASEFGAFRQQTLQMALRSGSENFDKWAIQRVEQLENAQLPKAAIRLMRVVSQATQQCGGNWGAKREYIRGYFFEEFLGLGVPSLQVTSSALNAMRFMTLASSSSTGRQQAMPSVPMGCPSIADSAGVSPWADLSSLSGGSRSAAGGMSVAGSSLSEASLAETIAKAVEAALDKRSVSANAGGGGGDRDRETGKKCMFCQREGCTTFSGGRPCREANQAANALFEKRKKQREDDAKKKDDE